MAEIQAERWSAKLSLRFERQWAKTCMRVSERVGPLSVQRPFYPEEDVCHAYILHPPGGVVGGDQLELNIQVGEQSSALITTPAANKIYRSNGPESRIKQYPHQFSGGMRQRVMIAMALSCNPRLIIADEPTTALDVTIQAQILDLMKSLTTEFGVALIVITHNLGVVARYADRVNIMYAGKVIERGNAREISANPRHPYTVGLLRSVPRLDLPRRAKLDPIEGQPPDLIHLPGGCSFAPRCKWAVDKCKTDIPELTEAGEGHLSACWRAEDLGPSAIDFLDDPVVD